MNIHVRAQSKQNVDVDVEASVVFSVAPDKAAVTEAANRFLGVDLEQVLSTARDIFSGETRAIIGTLTVEEMISDRMALAMEVLTNAEPKMSRFGWQIDSFQINSISDPSGYINALSAPELARVEREKAVAEAQRDAEITEEREKAARQKSMYERETEMVIAENEKAVAQSQAEARNAGPLAQAEAGRTTAIEQAKLREAQLLTDIIKPAEAAAKERIIEAEAKARTAIAEGIAAHNGIALDDRLVNQMPEIIESFAEGLKGSDLTVIGDGKDITKLFAEFAATVPQFRSMLNPTNNQATE